MKLDAKRSIIIIIGNRKNILLIAVSLLSSSAVLSSVLEKRQNAIIINSSLTKKQYINSKISCFYSNISVLLQVNRSVDVLKVIKSIVCIFDQKTIALRSTYFYKNSNYL